MKSKAKLIILIFLVLLIAGFLYSKYFYHPAKLTGQAVLSWSKSEDPSVVGYKVYYGTEPRKNNCPSGGYNHAMIAGNATSYTVRNLEAGKTYYFSVTSYNDSKKESCFSEEMKKTITISKWEKLKELLNMGKK